MSDRDHDHDPNQSEPKGTAKRPYEPPKILSREKLEVVAALCTAPGSKPDPVNCPSGPPQS